jgi:peroxiredoxin
LIFTQGEKTVEYVLVVSSILLWIMLLLNLLLTLALVRKVNKSSQGQQQPKGLEPGTSAPDFSASTLDGETVTLARYAGRSAAFIFMSTHCAPCRTTMPELEKVYPLARQAGVEMVLVMKEDAEEVRRFLQEMESSIPALIAPPGKDSFHERYQSPGTPSYCIIDEQGIVLSSGHPTSVMGDWQQYVESWRKKEVAGSRRS